MGFQTREVNLVSTDAGFTYILSFFQGLSQEFVENSVRVLVTRFLPLNASDLESWMSDPEEWMSTEEKESARCEFEIRVRVCVCVLYSS